MVEEYNVSFLAILELLILVYAVATAVKKYVKSVFGASSPQFAQVKGIEFKKPKI